MKKIIGILLTAILLVGSLSSAAFGATKMTITEKAEFQKQLDAVAKKHGGKAVVTDNVDQSTITLKFNSIEDFDKAWGTIKVETIVPSKSIKANGLTRTYTRDHIIKVLRQIVGTVTHKVVATKVMDPYYGRYSFTEINSHKCYTNGVALEWETDYQDADIIDSGETIAAECHGTASLKAEVAGVPLSWSDDFDLYDEFYYDE